MDTDLLIAKNILNILDIKYIEKVPCDAMLAVDNHNTASYDLREIKDKLSDNVLRQLYENLFLSWLLYTSPVTNHMWGVDKNGNVLPFVLDKPFILDSDFYSLYTWGAGMSANPENMILVENDKVFEDVCRNIFYKITANIQTIVSVVQEILIRNFDVKSRVLEKFLWSCRVLGIIFKEE